MKYEEEIPEELLDFHPDHLEIEHGKVPWQVRALLYVIGLMFVVAVVWASVAKVDRIVTAQGKLAPIAKPVVLQPIERAVLKSIDVSEGQRVKKGQILATLDPTFAGAELASTDYETQSLRAQLARIDAEIMGAADYPPPPPGVSPRDADLQRRLFYQRRDEYRSRIESFNNELKSLRQNIQTKEAERNTTRKQGKLSDKLLEMYEKAMKSGAIAQAEYMRIQAQDMDWDKVEERLDNEVDEIRAAILKVESDKQAFIGSWRNSLSQKRLEVSRVLEETRGRLVKTRFLNQLQNLTAPADAIVLQIINRAPGAVINEAEPVVTLVPADELQARVQVEPKDIGFLRVGDPVRIKLEAFPFQKHGMVKGEVSTISEDAINAQRGGMEIPFYSCQVKILDATLDKVPDDFRLLPGMNVTAEVLVGKRRVIAYFLYPLIRAMDEAIREP